MTANTTTVNATEEVQSPAQFLEYKLANWLFLYIAPCLLIIGVAGNMNETNAQNII